jgi:ribosomal protein L11 methyltransferase
VGLPSATLAAGDGFGAFAHETTALALGLLGALPDGPALDAGCGAGLLGIAWAASGKGHAECVDVDPAAVAQARASVRLSGQGERAQVARREIATLGAADLRGRVVLANLPAPGHEALLGVRARPRAALLAGARRHELRAIVGEWWARGYRPRAASRSGRWEAWVVLYDRTPSRIRR